MKANPKILVTAGEESADRHAACVVREIKKLLPDACVFGMGGHEMASAGVELIYSMKEISVMGFVDVLPKLAGILKVYSGLKKTIRERKPDLFIPVDLPDFNMRLAGFAKKSGIKVLYYIAPQAWAWRPSRARTLSRITDGLAVIFPFEEDFFRKSGVSAGYVGHPFLEENNVIPADSSWPVRRIAMMPGSRRNEITGMLPVMTEAKRIVDKEVRGIEWLLPVAKGLDWPFVKSHTDEDVKLVSGIPDADMAVVKSGTACFEAAIKGIPEVICYRTSPVNYFLARLFVKVEAIGMPNIALGRKVVPELIQHDLTPERLAGEVLKYIGDRDLFMRTKKEFSQLRASLEGGKASEKVAQWAQRLIRNK
jgi:lipid-A-disaccharide synthase